MTSEIPVSYQLSYQANWGLVISPRWWRNAGEGMLVTIWFWNIMCLKGEISMQANLTMIKNRNVSGVFLPFCINYSRYNSLVLPQQVQGAWRSMYQLPVASSRNIQGGDLWLGWTYQVLGLSDTSSLEPKRSLWALANPGAKGNLWKNINDKNFCPLNLRLQPTKQSNWSYRLHGSSHIKSKSKWMPTWLI